MANSAGAHPAAPPPGSHPVVPLSAFCRVTVVAPGTRIDMALPADVAVADLLPMVLKMAGESTPDGGARHGGWCLARLGDSPIDPSQTLSSLGILDGDLLQLRRRSENPPPPLFDDVVEAVAASAPGSYRPWTANTATTLGMVASGLALMASAVALLLAGPGLGVALLAGLGALATLAAGAVIARVYQETSIGVLVASVSPALGFVSGLYLVPTDPGAANLLAALGAEHLLLGATLALVLAATAIMVIGGGITPFVAIATAATLAALAGLVATLITHPAAGIAAGTAAIALAAISALPRLTIQLARLPLPQVPSNANDLQENPDFPDIAAIERRTGLAHDFMTGMIIGAGAAAAGAAIIAAWEGGGFGVALGVVVATVLLLRARSYANGSQAVALLISGMATAGGLLAGSMMATNSPLIFVGLLVLAAVALVLGVVFPRRRFSPVMRRSVDVTEAVLIAAVVPLALGVMDLYNTFRTLAL